MPAYSLALFDASNVPLTTASPVVLAFFDKTLAPRTPPSAPTHLGGGIYGYNLTDADVIAGSIILIDAGAGAFPRYTVRSFFQPDEPVFAWVLLDGTGALWAGAAPTITTYIDNAGGALTPPSVLMPYTYVAVVVPTAPDVLAGARMIATSAAGCESPYMHGEVDVAFGGGGGPGATVNFFVNQVDDHRIRVTFSTPVLDLTALHQPSRYVCTAPPGLPVPSITNVTVVDSATLFLDFAEDTLSGGAYTLAIAADTTFAVLDFGEVSPNPSGWTGTGVTYVEEVRSLTSTTTYVKLTRNGELTGVNGLHLAANWQLLDMLNLVGFPFPQPYDLGVSAVDVLSTREFILTHGPPIGTHDQHRVNPLGVDYLGGYITNNLPNFAVNDNALVVSIEVLDSSTLKVTFSKMLRLDAAFFTTWNWALAVRLGYAKPVYVKQVGSDADFGNTSNVAFLYLRGHLTQAGRYALRVQGLKDHVGNDVSTPDFPFTS